MERTKNTGKNISIRRQTYDKDITIDHFYVGYTKNLKLRFEKHNNGYIESTKNRPPLKRIYYEAGAINRPDKLQVKVIDGKVVAKERKKEFEISRISRFRYRTRYFTDSGIIGSKEFVAINYQRFKHLLGKVPESGLYFSLFIHRRLNTLQLAAGSFIKYSEK
ncbi:hypothetical protein D1BOALGB6SA_7645 [Olavius sp. associated proteobacterium Delta 1]|nr:hypothetical protein D1BOALGB6SA_7645 [Olavius sp. associated proteobacterium Delta 1]